MNNNLKPAIRFKGFTEAWEQRKDDLVGDEFDMKGLSEFKSLLLGE